MPTPTLLRIVTLFMLLFAQPAAAVDPPPAADESAPAAIATPSPPTTPPPLRFNQAAEAVWQRHLHILPPDELALLTAREGEFYAIERREQRGTPRGGAVLIHDIGDHPDLPPLLSALREELAIHGWHSITPQLPLTYDPLPAIPPDEWIDAAIVRLQAALNHLASRNIFNVAIIGHGSGGYLALRMVANQPQAAVRGLVVVNLAVNPSAINETAVPALLAQIPLPILDIYGDRASALVTETASSRATLARRAQRQRTEDPAQRLHLSYGLRPIGDRLYRQVAVVGGNHQMAHLELQTARRITGWLNRQISGQILPQRLTPLTRKEKP
jgi:pimeloyl-ACP methyl ester carboxylesterase